MSLTSYRAAPPRGKRFVLGPRIRGGAVRPFPSLRSPGPPTVMSLTSYRAAPPRGNRSFLAPQTAPDAVIRSRAVRGKAPREGRAQDRSRARALCSKQPPRWEAWKVGFFAPAKSLDL